jgi:group I intron endonuclease
VKGIYCIRNSLTQKIYIGKSNWDIEKRWKNHVYKLKAGTHDNRYLQRSFDKHGMGSFEFLILEQVQEITDIELSKKETQYIQQFDSTSRDKGYNLTLGGEGRKHSHREDTKLKISNASRAYWRREGTLEKHSDLAKRHILTSGGVSLTIPQVIEIKKLLTFGNLTCKDISELYGISSMAVRNISTLKSWSYVGMEYNTVMRSRQLSKAKLSSGGKGKRRPKSAGSNNGRAVLSEANVIQIKKLLAIKTPHKKIASQFNVSESAIKAIKSGRRWAHVTL